MKVSTVPTRWEVWVDALRFAGEVRLSLPDEPGDGQFLAMLPGQVELGRFHTRPAAMRALARAAGA